MTLRENILKLMQMNISVYRIAKGAEVPENTVRRLWRGESSLDNITLLLAEKLNKYYLEVVEMTQTVNFEGKKITLTQDAYLDGTHEAPHYQAAGVDAAGNEVIVKWEIFEHWLNEDGSLNGELEDETDACDWDNPVEVEGLKVYMKHVDTGAVKTIEEWTEIATREFTEIFNDDESLQEEFESLQAYLNWNEQRGNFFADLFECDNLGNKIDYIGE